MKDIKDMGRDGRNPQAKLTAKVAKERVASGLRRMHQYAQADLSSRMTCCKGLAKQLFTKYFRFSAAAFTTARVRNINGI